MSDFFKRLFGENWKTTLLGVGVLVFVSVKCIIGGGQLFDCFSEGWNAAFASGAAGLAAGAQASRFK